MPTRPKRSLGQNFLRDTRVVDRIVSALDPGRSDEVVEIGPGQGALTGRLVAAGAKVSAIEFDRDLIGPLQEQFAADPRFRLMNADALTMDLDEFATARECGKLKLVANLPYNISTPILRKLITARGMFSIMVLMFQREVVERITAPPGARERGYLTVLVENAFGVEYLFDVPPSAFYPVPKVWSAVVRLKPKPSELTDERSFAELVSVSFAHKRKTILNNLKNVFPEAPEFLEEAGIDGKRRAETLGLDEWTRVFSLSEKRQY